MLLTTKGCLAPASPRAFLLAVDTVLPKNACPWREVIFNYLPAHQNEKFYRSWTDTSDSLLEALADLTQLASVWWYLCVGIYAVCLIIIPGLDWHGLKVGTAQSHSTLSFKKNYNSYLKTL